MSMAAPRSAALLLVLAIVVAIISTAKSQPAVSDCSNVKAKIEACIPYLTGNKTATSACCTALVSLDALANGNSKALKKTCECLKSVANSVDGINIDNAASFPQQCGVNVPISITAC